MSDELPPELERRVALLEDPAEQGADFDAFSWFWLVFLGVALPVVLILAGWWA
jgi:hypothetical protein